MALGIGLGGGLPTQQPAANQNAGAAAWQGRVVAPDGTPLAGAAIQLGTDRTIATDATLRAPLATSDDAGRFTVAFPAADAATAGFAIHVAQRGRAAVLRPVERQTPDLGDIVLPAGSRMFGRVRDPAGNPLAGVRVVATDLLESATRFRVGPRHGFFCATTSTAGGIFDLPCALGNGVRLELSRPGYERTWREPVAIGAPLEIELRSTGWIAGRVLEQDGSSVAGATVVATYELRSNGDQVRTGPDGSFRLPLDRDCRWRLVARHHAGADAPREIRSRVLRGPQANLELLLPPAEADDAPKLRVRAVRAADGTAVERFTAVCLWQKFNVGSTGYREHRLRQLLDAATPTESGEAELPALSKANYGVLRVIAAGMAPATVADVPRPTAREGDADPGAPTDADEPVTVELHPEATVRGVVRIVDSDTPVAGALIWARFDPPANRSSYPETEPQDAVRSGPDGSFTLPGLGEGRWRIEVRHPSHPRGEPQHVELAAAEQRADVTLTLPTGARVAGRLTGIEVGSGASVMLNPMPRMAFATSGARLLGGIRSNAGDPRQQTLGDDNEFRFDGVPLGNHEIVLRLPSKPRLGDDLYLPIEPFRVRPAGIEREFDCSADRPGRLHGRVTFARATTAFEHLLVIAEPGRNGRAPTIQYNSRFAGPRSFVGRDGAFDIRVGPGLYWLHVVDFRSGITLHRATERTEVDTAATHEVDVELDLTRVDLELTTLAGVDEPAAFDRIEVRFAPTGADAARLGNRQYDSGNGILWPTDSETLTLALPPGTAAFYARSAVRHMRTDRDRHSLPPLCEAELEIPAGSDRLTCELPLIAPPEIPAADGVDGPKDDGDAAAGIPVRRGRD